MIHCVRKMLILPPLFDRIQAAGPGDAKTGWRPGAHARRRGRCRLDSGAPGAGEAGRPISGDGVPARGTDFRDASDSDAAPRVLPRVSCQEGTGFEYRGWELERRQPMYPAILVPGLVSGSIGLSVGCAAQVL